MKWNERSTPHAIAPERANRPEQGAEMAIVIDCGEAFGIIRLLNCRRSSIGRAPAL